MGKYGMTNRRAAVTYMFMDPPPEEKNYINRGLAFLKFKQNHS